MLNEKIVAIIQARMNSSRLPGKVMKTVGGKSILEILVTRLKKSRYLDDIVIATTTKKADDVIEVLSNELDVNCYRGSEENVLKRYIEAAEAFNSDIVVRITSDNPLTDVELMDKLIETHLKMESDYTYCDDTPLGLSSEIINQNILNNLYANTYTPEEREHVTLYIRSHPNDFRIVNFDSGFLNQDIRLTLDTNADLRLMNSICDNLGDLENLMTEDIIEFLKNNPRICKINEKIQQKTPLLSKNIKFAFITDGNSKIGLGHLYRSFTLAKQLKKEIDLQIFFLTRSDRIILNKIEEEGFSSIKFDNDYELLNILRKIDVNMIIID